MRRMIRKMISIALAVTVMVSIGMTPIKQVKAHVRNIRPGDYNKQEITTSQFDSVDDYETYMQNGGAHFYNDQWKEGQMVKITAGQDGYFVFTAENDEDTAITLYDESKTKILAKSNSDDDIEYAKRVKAGENFYVKMPSKVKKIGILTAIIKDNFFGMKENNTYYQAGDGKPTYHPFTINKRAAVEINISSIERNGGSSVATIEKYSNGKWKKTGYTAKIKPQTYDDDFVHGLEKGNYRLVLTSANGQLLAVSYSKRAEKKDYAYKRSKAKKISLNQEKENLYTSAEKASRWYKVIVKSSTKKKELTCGKDTVSGGYKFTIYKKGKKKPIKTVKVKSNANAKTVKLPKKKGTYNIKVSKLTKNTNGTYMIGYYNSTK